MSAPENLENDLNIKRLTSWEAFENEIDSLFERIRQKRSQTRLPVSTPIFRGLAGESWRLTTTLERYSAKEYSVQEYYKIMRGIKPALESFMEKRWDLPDEIAPIDNPYLPPEGYPFMIYLRHHGFPSPLLDWTTSPYVAAFFAFESPLPRGDNVAIYSYLEYYGDVKSGSTHVVSTIGSYVTTDRRHHIQQCRYSFARKQVSEDNYVYCNHEEAFAQKKVTVHDIVTKYLIPSSERSKVLAKLDFMNINAYSLFGDEEHLMKLLAYREIQNPIKPY